MNNLCQKEEKIIFALRALYQKYAYKQYRMSKFEEYDLYIKNKNFLVSDNIITFTDTDGKLLALKPDVTLSIIKNLNYDETPVKKVYYNENVYRVAKGTNSFKEIMQVGLECIGKLDDYTIYETMMLAIKSLKTISDDYIMDISHIGIVSKIIEKADVSENTKKEIEKAVKSKNFSELEAIEKRESKDLSQIKKLITPCGSVSEVMPFLKSIDSDYVSDFIKVAEALDELDKGKIRIDFSIMGDSNYYNGFIFKGFINGVPASVLSGGEYDNLMAKFGRKEKAIGFAVYLDLLERMSEEKTDFDVDIVLLYEKGTDIKEIKEVVEELSKNNERVSAQTEVPEKLSYKKLLKLTRTGVEIVENNA